MVSGEDPRDLSTEKVKDQKLYSDVEVVKRLKRIHSKTPACQKRIVLQPIREIRPTGLIHLDS